MEEQVQHLVSKTWKKYKELSASQRLLIAISGIPGSGKTTLASLVALRLNQKHSDEEPGCALQSIATFVPMDGYHLSRAQLSAMPNATIAFARRGAAFTFDAQAFLTLVKRLRDSLLPESTTIYAPSFDHATKDPVDDDIAIPASARVVVLEGNYLSLNKGLWKEAAGLMDELWFVAVDLDIARRRLVRRHLKAGIATTDEEAHKRVTENDLVNGMEIVDNRLETQELIASVEDDRWSPEAQAQYGDHDPIATR